jgi:hypothetical protein
MTFTSVNKDKLQRAFALAHRASESDKLPATTRARFREIAVLIWDAHGEQGHPARGAGAELLNKMEAPKEIAQ